MHTTIIIGEVLKPQGVRGEIKIKPYIDDIADMKRFKTLFLCGKEYKVLACRVDASAAYYALNGIADRDAAELLRGASVEALREEVPAPPEGRYFIVDIIGCKVVDERGVLWGEISDVLPAHTDIFVMKNGGREYMFPAADGVIVATDIGSKTITVQSERLLQVMVEQG